ncbi:TetR family transcriptional regulator [Caulobacter sp. SLTY]|uniref:TetR family transcriptional regulator n=1 Tax=Caulobacter sp. SLTY TaxID=2683262 RepID=UPI0014123C13|nr:TetR family transcriptional regulator [Caulobacter sp. SLTY]
MIEVRDNSAGKKIRPQARARRREKILRAAADVLVDIGLRQATMDDIARELKTAKILLYRYFDTKEALIEAVLQRVVDRFVALEHQPWPGMEPAMERTLATARVDSKAFLLVFRLAAHDPVLARYGDEIRNVLNQATRARLTMLGHPLASDPLFFDALVEGVNSFLIEATAFWIERGDPARDGEWLRWVSDVARAMARRPRQPNFEPLPPVFGGPAPDQPDSSD